MKRALIAIVTLTACGAAAAAQSRQSAAPPAQPQLAVPQTSSRPGPLANLGSGTKEPIKIDADRLDVFDKEQRAVFSGNVVAVQGESTVHCAQLTVLYEQQRGQAPGARPASPPSGMPGQDGAIRRIDCKGPVTVVSKTQTATGDNAVFDRTANRVVLTGNVALSDGPNVTRGDRIVYDLNSGIANVETTTGGRVRALFVPGAGPDAAQGGSQSSSQAQPPRQPGRRPVQTN
ncbi:MAG TPA: LptA/OstA family protein [Beijerinckiaceae bacterium]|jgi:lipopolysaccharide export system protein LptA